MAGQPIRNIDLFKKYNIPYREFAKDQIVIDTAKISYLVDLVPIKNNPYVFKVFNMTGNRTTIESKDTFLRRLCKHFKLDFVHWKENVDVVENLYTKEEPKEIKIGNEYTTTWANPVAKWILKDILEDDQVIMVSPKTQRPIISKLSDLRIWIIKK
jgi:hypothetical protein